MADLIPICAADALAERGRGIRFPLTAGGEDASGFVVRYDGVARGYLNRCAHVPIELDWNEGEFFDSSGLYLMCSTHGAMYLPESGRCAGGPCRGGRLRPIAVVEKDDMVFWQTDDFLTPARA
ncbi:Rieske (2Fe-2S) protein [Noviherbaspirillum sedimenti]|uniref:Rieske (2Fe-2S) protein n=1 Tax=Noviherbaspirillum sedimenti TaxID=2320865 RepID=A0A3A3GGK8_9BURK|nr:Rieske 2Fe-2S domain-containing protein [Noviherbaspirillum sedimenti]RJG01406.1 Rieske (2Fe-2S) protein [Noviherbaspirillum sedimenti]